MIFTNPSQSRESILILEWGKHSLSFSVFHEQDNRILTSQFVKSFHNLFDFTKQEFEKIIQETEVFSYSFQKVVCLVDAELMTLVPTKFVGEKSIENFLKFNFELPSGNLVYQKETVLSSSYQALFILPKNLKDAMTSNFREVSYTYSNVALLNYFAKFIQLDSFFNIQFNENYLAITYYKENKLLFHNSFHFISAEDIVYHILNVMNELNLNPERELVYYSGIITEESDKMSLLKDYLKFLKPIERTNKLNYNKEVQEMASHYFLSHYANCL